MRRPERSYQVTRMVGVEPHEGGKVLDKSGPIYTVLVVVQSTCHRIRSGLIHASPKIDP